MFRRFSLKSLLVATVVALPAFLLSGGDLSSAQQQQLPTIAILDFLGGGTGRNAADMSALGAAIPHHLGYVLASNPRVRLVDRARIQEVIREQDLGAAGRLDSASMVRIGRILGAQYILSGSFIVQDDGEMAISTTSTNMETSQVAPQAALRGRVNRVLNLLDSLGAQLTTSLRLPAIPPGTPRAPAPVASLDQNRLILLEGAALKAEDRGETAAAIEIWKQVAAMSPAYEGAKVRLAKLGG